MIWTDPRPGASTVPEMRAPGWSASVAVGSLFAAMTTAARAHARIVPGLTIKTYFPTGTSAIVNRAPGSTRAAVTGTKPTAPASCINNTLMPAAPAPGPAIDPAIVPVGDGFV